MRFLWLMMLVGLIDANACEVLVKAREVAHQDPEKDRVGRLKIGMIADVRPDGWKWGGREALPRFYLIKFPGVDPAKLSKYLEAELSDNEFEADNQPKVFRARKWQIQVESIPLAARNRLKRDGELTIKASGGYTGSYDYTWAQFRAFLKNLKTNNSETGDL